MSKRISGILNRGLQAVKRHAKAATVAVAVAAVTLTNGVAFADPAPVTVTEQIALSGTITALATILATVVAAAVGAGLGFWIVRAGMRWIKGTVKG